MLFAPTKSFLSGLIQLIKFGFSILVQSCPRHEAEKKEIEVTSPGYVKMGRTGKSEYRSKIDDPAV